MANGIEFQILGDETIKDELDLIPAMLESALGKAFFRCGNLAVRESKRNAPRSPTKKQMSNQLKRKKRTAKRSFAGGLEKSIRFEADKKQCSVFVPLNSPAGKYARYIHDDKGKKWFKRGIGTIAKGARADAKYVERAINDNVDKYIRIINDEIMKASNNEMRFTR